MRNSDVFSVDEQILEVARENAQANYAIVAASLPKRLVQKEERLLEWYGRLKGNSLTKLEALFDFMSDLYSEVGRFTPCKKGCTACCHYPISITELEILFIEKSTGVRRLKEKQEIAQYHGFLCPFLKNNACSIYNHRPFVCRRHVSLTKTAYWCDPSRSNTGTFPLLAFSEVDRVFNLLVSGSKSASSYDIRQVFGPYEREK
jgi:uncharacterized protein